MPRDRNRRLRGDGRAGIQARAPISARIAVALTFVALFMLNLHTLPGLGGVFQIVGSVTIIVASAFAYISRPATWRLTPIEVVGILICLVSLGVNLSGYAAYLDYNDTSLQITLLLLPVLIACGTLARCLPIATQLRVYAWCLGIGAIFAMVLNLGNFLSGLSGNGLDRYGPFGMHPNLAGLTDGLGMLLSLFLIFDRGFQSRAAGWVFLPVQTLSVLASGSRGATLGLVMCVIIAGLARWTRLPKPVQRMFLSGFGMAALLAALRGPQLYNYLISAFSIESKGRGLGSGGSGRMDQWLLYPQLVFSSPERMMFGTGLRTLIVRDPSVFVDSTYLYGALQYGAPLVFAMIAVILLTCWRMHWSQKGHGFLDLEKLVLFLIVIYMAVAAIFINNTLFGVGNAGSYIFFILFVLAWLLGGQSREKDGRSTPLQGGFPDESGRAAWRAEREERQSRRPAIAPPHSSRQTSH